jgi:hypothetical protein
MYQASMSAPREGRLGLHGDSRDPRGEIRLSLRTASRRKSKTTVELKFHEVHTMRFIQALHRIQPLQR